MSSSLTSSTALAWYDALPEDVELFLRLHAPGIRSTEIPSLIERFQQQQQQNLNRNNNNNVSSSSSCAAAAATPDDFFTELYQRYRVTETSAYLRAGTTRLEVAARLQALVPAATFEAAFRAAVTAEMKGFAERDAKRMLERSCGVVTAAAAPVNRPGPPTSSTTAAATTIDVSNPTDSSNPRSHMSGGMCGSATSGAATPLSRSATPSDTPQQPPHPSRSTPSPVPPPAPQQQQQLGHNLRTSAAVEQILSDDIQRWVATVIGPPHNQPILPLSSSSSPSAEPTAEDGSHYYHWLHHMRNGALLTVFWKRLQNPQQDSATMALPKRAEGFFARDLVAKVLQEVQTTFGLPEHAMCSVGDLCDAASGGSHSRGDRNVISMFLALATAYATRMAQASSQQQQQQDPATAAIVAALPTFVTYQLEIDRANAEITNEDVDAVIAEVEEQQQEQAASSSPPRNAANKMETTTTTTATSSSPLKQNKQEAIGSGLAEPSKPAPLPAPPTQPSPATNDVREEENEDAAVMVQHYKARANDPVDEAVARVMERFHSRQQQQQPTGGAGQRRGSVKSSTPAAGNHNNNNNNNNGGTAASWKLRAAVTIGKLKQQGAYVVYHRISRKRTVVHVRVAATKAVMRVGGGWEGFEEWLDRHAVDLEGVAKGAAAL